MGDISREPLSTGPSPRGKRRKGPAEVIRLEEITIEESSIDEAPASDASRGTREPEECVVEQAGSDERAPEAGDGPDGPGSFDAAQAGDVPERGAKSSDEPVEGAPEIPDPDGESSEMQASEMQASEIQASEILSSEIVVRPRPDLAAALHRDQADGDVEDFGPVELSEADQLSEADRAVPEVDQLVSDDPEEQIAEPMLAEPTLGDDEGGEFEPGSGPDEDDTLGIVEAEDSGVAPFAPAMPLEVPAELPLESAASVPSIDDDAEVPELTEPGALSRVLVAVLLTAREPMKAVRLAEICNSSQKAVEAALERLDEDLRAMGMPLEVVHAGETIRLGTSPEVFPYLVRLRKARKAERLSPAALETLAVIAYQQPVIRLEIEAIRGVKVGPMLKSLLDHKLVKVVGRADVPGRPLQYGTTQVFLERFGLRSLKDLPSVQEFRSLG